MNLVLLFLSTLALVLAEPQQYGNQRQRQQQYKQPVAQQYSQPQQYQQPQQRTQQYNPAPRAVVPILAYSNDVSPDGSYTYSYQTGDGTSVQESGYLKNLGQETAQSVQGSYSYTAPDGTPITVTYIADENGFRAEGAHLPTPPPIPEAIQRSLDLIAATQRQQPQQQYQEQQQQYKQPQQNYRQPQQNYQQPQQQYKQPQQNYGQPQQNYRQPQRNN